MQRPSAAASPNCAFRIVHSAGEAWFILCTALLAATTEDEIGFSEDRLSQEDEIGKGVLILSLRFLG